MMNPTQARYSVPPVPRDWKERADAAEEAGEWHLAAHLWAVGAALADHWDARAHRREQAARCRERAYE